MNPPKKIIEIYDLLNEGVFVNREINSLKLFDDSNSFLYGKDANCDLEYFYSHSGDKSPSSWIDKIYERYGEDEQVLTTQLTQLFEFICKKFQDKWNRLYVSLVQTTYNPIHNYNMDETENVGTDVEVSQDTSSYGFNSSNDTPTGKASNHTTGDKTKNERDLHREGNIGVTTNQQMLTAEIELRKNDLLNIMYLDIDSVLCSSIYELD